MNPQDRWKHLGNDQSHDKKSLTERIVERIANNKKIIAEGVDALLRTAGTLEGDHQRLTFLRALTIETNVLESVANNTIE